jgi:hypothetical protein
MKFFVFCFASFAFLLIGCRPSAPPVSISNKPISATGFPQTNLPLPPSKPLGEMTWKSFDGKTQKLADF